MTKVSDPSAAPIFTGAINTLTPSWGQIWDRTKEIAPAALAVGAGGASLIQLLKMFRDQREAEAAAKPRGDVLTVEVDPMPQKTANVLTDKLTSAWDWMRRPYMESAQGQVTSPEKQPHLFSENAMRIAIGLGALGTGAMAANSFFERSRKKELEDRLAKAKAEYSSLLGKSLVGGSSPIKTADLHIHAEYCPTIAGLFDVIARASFPADQQKIASNGNPLAEVVGVPMTLLTLSGILSHKWLYNRLKEQEKVQETKMPAPPREIRLVTKPQPTTQAPQPAMNQLQAPNESDVILPEEENPSKAAAIALYDTDGSMVVAPNEAGMPLSAGDRLSGAGRTIKRNAGTNALLGAGVGAGIGLSNAFRSNESPGSKLLTGAGTTALGAGVGILAGGALDTVLGFLDSDAGRIARAERGMKMASPLDGVLDGMGFGGLQQNAVGAVVPAELRAGGAAPAPAAPPSAVSPVKMVEVGPGTVAAETAGGPITIEAEDPNAARVLQANRGKLKKVLTVLQAQNLEPQAA